MLQASAPGPIVTWPRSVQIAFGLLLGAGFCFLAGKWLLQSLEAGPSTLPTQRVDLNFATPGELMLLPGVGEQLAQRIVKVRAERGPFAKVADLRRVPGIGPAALERLRPSVFVSANPPPAGAAPSLPVTVEPTKKPVANARKGINLAGPIDINAAGAAELRQIPGIGPVLSQRIVDARSQKPFATVADLRRVRGIGPKTLEKMRPFVTVSPVK
jgi:competence protein ComEA